MPKEEPRCFHCGETNHVFRNCKYKTLKCEICKKVGHIAKICKTGLQVQGDDSFAQKIDPGMDLQPSTSSTSLLLNYDRRGGTNNLGFEFERKITALVALRCIALQDTEDMWIGSNVDHIGDFDDIVLCRRTTDGRRLIYLIQLKHQQEPQNIPTCEFENKNGKFSVLKYTKTFESLKQQLQCQSNNEQEVIQHLRQADEMFFVLYTNKGVDECDILKECDNSTVDFLNTCVTQNPSKFSLTNSAFPQRLILLPNQVHVNNANNLIEKEIGTLLGPPFNPLKTIVKKFVEFIKAWSEGTKEKKYFTLTKQDVINKLSDILLDSYKYKFPSSNIRDYKQNIWNKITQDKNITIVESDKLTKKFLNRRMGSELNMYLKGSEESWEDELDETTFQSIRERATDLETSLLKMNSSHQKITVFDLYVSMWLTNKIPLLLKAKRDQDYEIILNILKLSKFRVRVTIIKKAPLQCNSTTVPTKYFNTLDDLNNEDRLSILKMPVKLQNRPDHKLVDLMDLTDECIFKLITCNNVIQIIEGDFNVGNQYEALDEFHIDRCLSRIFLYPIIFKEVADEIFVLKCTAALEKHSFPNNVMVVEESIILEDIESPGKVIHEIIMDGDGSLEWKRSLGTTKNIQKYVIEDKIAWITFQDGIQYFMNDVHVITASPGMGKSIFTDYMAVNTPKNTWIIKLILNKYRNQYKDIQNKSQIELLHFFAHELLGKCDNLELSNQVFQKCFHSNRVLIVFDGYDEIVSENETEVIHIAKCLRNDKLPLWITTRPNKKCELEDTFSTIAMTINPLTPIEHKMLLIKYFTKLCRKADHLTQEYFTTSIKSYVEDLHAKIGLNLKDSSKFLTVPLHIRMLAEVFSNDFENLLITGDIMVKKFNLVELYEQFIKTKTDIVCEKFGSVWSESRKFIEKSQKLFALKFLYSYRVESLKIDEQLNEYYNSEEYKLSCLQREGIIVIEKKRNGEVFYYNINFTHRTFAEFLAAQWLFEHIHDPDIQVKRIVKRLLDDGNEIVVRKMFSLILAKGCLLHEAVLLGHIEEIPQLLRTTSINDVDKGGRTIFHILATTLNDNQSLTLIDCVKKQSNVDIPTTKDDVSEFTVLDHLISRERYRIANEICKIFPNLTITYCKHKKEQLLLLCAQENYRRLFEAALRYYVSRDMLLHRLDKNTMIGPYCNLPRESTATQSILKNYISEYCTSTISELFQRKTENIDSPFGDYYYDLNIACAFGTKENVKYLLSQVSEINSKHLEITPLHHSTRHKCLETVKLLINKGAEIEKLDQDERTALHYAVSTDITIELLSNSSNTAKSHLIPEFHSFATIGKQIPSNAVQNTCTNFNSLPTNQNINSVVINTYDSKRPEYYPLHRFAGNGSAELIEKLLAAGESINIQDDDGDTPLNISLKKGHLQCARILLSYGANADLGKRFRSSPLHYVAEHGSTELIPKLLAAGASINKQDGDGDTPLNIALKTRHYECARMLLSYGANADLENKFRSSPLHYVAENGATELIPELLTAGTSINKQDGDGNTPLNIAFTRGHLECARMLLLNGSNVDLEDNWIILKLLPSDTIGNPDYSPLHTAAYHGYTDTITELLSRGKSINEQDTNGYTPLHVAVQVKKLDCAKMLLLRGANADIEDNHGCSPLHAAAQRGYTDILTELLSKGASINKRDIHGDTPLAIALKHKDLGSVKILLSNDVHVNLDYNHGYSPLHVAAENGYTDIILQLLNKGASINKQDIRGDTPLLVALKHKKLDSVKLLLSKEVDVDLDYRNGYSALHIAAENGYIDIISELLKKGANINKRDTRGDTPLGIALRHREFDSVIVLLSNDADVNLENNEGHSALHIAAKNGYVCVISELLLKGASINKQDKNGDTPFALALRNRQFDSAIILFLSNADINLDNNEGYSPLHVVARNGYVGAIPKLLSKGASINKQDTRGDTPLAIAIRHREYDSVIMLLTNDADVNLANKNGYSPLHVAADNGYTDIIPQLLSKGASINKQDNNGDTPLSISIRYRNLDIAQMLLSNVDDLNLKFDEFSLHYKARSSTEIISLLLSNDACIDKQDIYGDTPLHLALMAGNLSSAKFLLSLGANNNLENYRGRSSLHYAAENCPDVIDELVRQGSKINKQDNMGDTPLHAALIKRNLKSASLFLSKQDNCILESSSQNSSMHSTTGSGYTNLHVNIQNKQGKTPLHYAVNLDATTVELLLNMGAVVNLENGNGETPLHTVLMDSDSPADDVTFKRRVSIVRLLVDKGADINIQDKNRNTPVDYINVHRSIQNYQVDKFYSEVKLLLNDL